MSTTKFTVVIPANAEEKLALAELVFAKHLAEGDQSPLNGMKTHKWETSGPSIAEGLLQHKKAEELKKQMDKAYADRDSILNEITITLKASRDILSGVFNQNPRDLGEWGFEVHEPHHKPTTSNGTATTL